MRKILLGLALMCSVTVSQAQLFPSSDSLGRFIDKYIRTSVIESYKNMRMNTAMQGLRQLVNQGGGGTSFDSTYIYAAVNLRVRYSDTALMQLAYRNALLNRLLISDTAGMLGAYQSAYLARIRWADTTALFGDYRTALLGRSLLGHTHIATDVTEDATRRFVTDAEKTTWNAKQSAITTGTTAQYFRGDFSLATFPTNNTAFTNGAGYLVAADITGKANLSGGNSFSGNQSVTGDLTVTGSTFAKSIDLSFYTALGSSFKGEPICVKLSDAGLTSVALSDGAWQLIPVHVPVAATLTGIKFFQVTQGNFTGDNENSLALFTFSGGTLTRVAISANDANIWKGTANTWQSVAFTSTYAAAGGYYYVGFLYNNSAQTTAPVVSGGATNTQTNILSADFTNSMRLRFSVGGRTAQASSITASTFGQLNGNPYFVPY